MPELCIWDYWTQIINMADNAVFLFLQAIEPLCTVYQQHCRERGQQGNHCVLELKGVELILGMILNYIIPLFSVFRLDIHKITRASRPE